MKMIYLGSDHAGLAHKEYVKRVLEGLGRRYEDLGTHDERRVDYPRYAKAVAKQVRREDALGILVCGTGTGMAIAANRYKGVRAAFAYDEYSARKAREHNHANILTLRGREFPKNKIKKLVETWLYSRPSRARRHTKRIAQLDRT